MAIKQTTLAILSLALCSSVHAQDCGCKEDFTSKRSFVTYLQFKDGGDLMPVLVEDRRGKAVLDGHVILGPAKTWRDFGTLVRSGSLTSSALAQTPTLGPLGAMNGQRKWDDGVVPYVLPTGADKLSDAQKKAFDTAVTDWNKLLDKKITIREKQATDKAWITVKKVADGTCSWVMPGRTLELATGYIDCAAHEIGHALGLAHEHRRSDRETYLTVHRDRIRTDACPQYAPLDKSASTGAYNLGSVMHYFSKRNGCKSDDVTIEAIPPNKITRETAVVTKGDAEAALAAQGR